MSSVATLSPPANPAMLQIVAAIQQAQSLNVEKQVDARFAAVFAQILPQMQKALGEEAGRQLGVLQTAGLQVRDAIGKVEASLLDTVRAEAARTVAELAPRSLVVQTRDGLTVGRVDGHVRPEFDEIIQCTALGLNVMLVGPAGCGKTFLCEQIAAALGQRFAFLPLTAGVSESRLTGRFAPIGEGGQFKYVPAPFVDFYENGGVFLLDEVDAADANVLLAINAALANGHMETPNPAKPIIKRHATFRLIAAANTWGNGADRQYVGRNQLDASTLDRFCAAQFNLDYDTDFEKAAGHPEVVEWAHELRGKVRENRLRRVVSTRIILDGTLRLKAGHTLAQVKRSFLVSWSEADRRTVGE